ncbi:MAG TPA: rhomboid family intramembrane serine protease [Pseudomonadales bacterium]
MFPLSDDNPTARPPVATLIIILVNALVWAFVQGFGSGNALAESLCLHGLIPGDLLGTIAPDTRVPVSDTLVCVLDGQGNPTSLLTSMFMHGGWFHVIGNMWFLWVFGDNVEDVMGPLRFVAFYLLCGLAAAGAQIGTDPASTIPMVGASGAIGGVMGAYALTFPRARVNTLIFLGFYVTTIAVPAIFMLGYWFLLQILGGLPALGESRGGVAFWAHVGGFVAGLLLIGLFVRPDYLAAYRGVLRRKRSRPRDDERWF